MNAVTISDIQAAACPEGKATVSSSLSAFVDKYSKGVDRSI